MANGTQLHKPIKNPLSAAVVKEVTPVFEKMANAKLSEVSVEFFQGIYCNSPIIQKDKLLLHQKWFENDALNAVLRIKTSDISIEEFHKTYTQRCERALSTAINRPRFFSTFLYRFWVSETKPRELAAGGFLGC